MIWLIFATAMVGAFGMWWRTKRWLKLAEIYLTFRSPLVRARMEILTKQDQTFNRVVTGALIVEAVVVVLS